MDWSAKRRGTVPLGVEAGWDRDEGVDRKQAPSEDAGHEKFFDNRVDLFAYCLLPNHFHLLVHIPKNANDSTHLPFSHIFNS
jgi:hypothetical protein